MKKLNFNIDLIFLVVLALTFNIFMSRNSTVIAQVTDENLHKMQDKLDNPTNKKCKCPQGKKWNGKKCIKKTGDEVCITLFDPVCGCDGMTYSNSCNANQNGIKKFTSGECNSSDGSESLPVKIE